MENCPYTPEQVEEIKVLDEVTASIEDFAFGETDNTTWVTQVLNVPKALLEKPFDGLGAYALEEVDAHPVDWMNADLAKAAFVSYLGIIKAFKNDKDALRRNLLSDELRFVDIIARMAECAGLYDDVFDLESNSWTGEKNNDTVFMWDMPGGAGVRAMPVTDEEGTLWNFWVQKEGLMYCTFTVGVEGNEDPEGNPEFERLAWMAWHDAVLVLEAMAEAAAKAEQQLEQEYRLREFIDED